MAESALISALMVFWVLVMIVLLFASRNMNRVMRGEWLMVEIFDSIITRQSMPVWEELNKHTCVEHDGSILHYFCYFLLFGKKMVLFFLLKKVSLFSSVRCALT